MNPEFIKKAKLIKAVGTDIDGVWTDAGMYYTSAGEQMKCFSTYDGMGVQLLREKNIPTIILTSENSEIVLRRAEKLKIESVYINEKQKLNRMLEISASLNISMEEIAYIGDNPKTDFPGELNFFKIRLLKGEFSKEPHIKDMMPDLEVVDLIELENFL